MRALITGGAGFLGSRLGAALAARGSVVLADVVPSEIAGTQSVTLDITDVAAVRRVFADVKPDLVVHAAANKYVDLGEKDPFDCVDVNLLGSQNVARVAMEQGIAKVLGISSTAAAPPQVSVYGLAKAIMERMFCSLHGKTATAFTTVRLGNIAWSTGSVLPAWDAMREKTGVVKTSGPEDHRFIVSVDEAIATVLAAVDGFDGLAGKVLVRKSKQAKMRDVLDVFVAQRGGTIEAVEARVEGRSVEVLVGDLETPYAREATYAGAPHVVISFNEKAATPLTEGVFANQAASLSRDEISALVARA